MAFGLFHPFGFSTDPFFDDGFFGGFGPFGLSSRRLTPRRSQLRNEDEVLCAPVGGCAPLRRRHAHYRSRPSVLDLLSFNSDFDRLFDLYEEDRDEQEAPVGALEASRAESSTPTSAVATKRADTVAKVTPTKAARLGHVDVRKTEGGATLIDVNLPGLDLENVKLDFDFKHQTLNIKAEQKTEEKDAEGKQTSYRYVSFSRSLPIPDGAKPEDVSADLVDGVLHISVTPKLLPASESTTVVPITGPSTMDVDLDAATPASPSDSSVESSSLALSEPQPVASSSSPAASVTIDAPDSNTATVEDAAE